MVKLTMTLRALVAAALLASAAVSVHADERIPFTRGALKGGDWAFFSNYLLAEYPLIVKDVSEIQGLDRDGALEYMRRLMLHDARNDITGDGSPELFVTVRSGYVCGTVGCETIIFEMAPNGWRDLASIMVTILIRDGPEHFVSDEVIDGYRTLYAEYYGLRWNGKVYDGFCVKRCEEG